MSQIHLNMLFYILLNKFTFPWLPQLHVEVSLSKMLNPKLLLMSSWHLAWQPLPSVYECVCEYDKCCKALWVVSRLEKRYRNASPFTIYQYKPRPDLVRLLCDELSKNVFHFQPLICKRNNFFFSSFSFDLNMNTFRFLLKMCLHRNFSFVESSGPFWQKQYNTSACCCIRWIV